MLHAAEFGTQLYPSTRAKLVVATARVVVLGLGSLDELANQTCVEHALERRVERSWSEADPTLRVRLDVFENLIAVPIFDAQREEHIEDGRGQREPGLRKLGIATHSAGTISGMDIYGRRSNSALHTLM